MFTEQDDMQPFAMLIMLLSANYHWKHCPFSVFIWFCVIGAMQVKSFFYVKV